MYIGAQVKIQSIKNQQYSPQFGQIVFKNQALWIKYGQEFLNDISQNKDLIKFATNNPDKDIIFTSQAASTTDVVLDFGFKVKERGFIGAIKSLFKEEVPVGRKIIDSDCGTRIYKTSQDVLSEESLKNQHKTDIDSLKYELITESWTPPTPSAYKEIQSDINWITKPNYQKTSLYTAETEQINNQRKIAVEKIKELSNQENISGDFQ